MFRQTTEPPHREPPPFHTHTGGEINTIMSMREEQTKRGRSLDTDVTEVPAKCLVLVSQQCLHSASMPPFSLKRVHNPAPPHTKIKLKLLWLTPPLQQTWN